MIQASFGGRNELRKEDHEIIKRLGLRFRGANAWPAFRSYRPGYLPWFLEDDEIEVLRLILEQVLDVAPRVKDDPALVSASDSHTFLVRVQRAQPPTWGDQRMDIMLPEPERIESFIDPKLIDRFGHPQRAGLRSNSISSWFQRRFGRVRDARSFPTCCFPWMPGTE